jgi:ubiquinone/menaquinone biosynthesis C-methylase UbiE
MHFLSYTKSPKKTIYKTDTLEILSFISENDNNIDKKTVDSFGDEWEKFDLFTDDEIKIAGDQYFDIVSANLLTKDTKVLDLGCGSGRWTKYIASKVELVEAVDPSNAVFSALKLNKDELNVRVTQASVSNLPFENESFDFIVCLGVLHHIPDTQKALIDLCKKLKSGGHILLYLYYNLDNRGRLYKLIFYSSTILRKVISKQPKLFKKIICDVLAFVLYFPFISCVKGLYFIFGKKKWIKKIPLSYYSDKSFNIIRNDALDRFGTPLEHRFSKVRISEMLENAGVSENVFSNNEPYWHVLGKKA